MEEILASIRRIIADDEAKPSAGEKSASLPAAAPAPSKPERPLAAPPAPKPTPGDAPPKPSSVGAAKAAFSTPAAPAPAATNSQDDIDALLAGLDESTTPEEIRPPQPDGEVLELTDEMAVPVVPATAAAPKPSQPAFQKVEPNDDLEFTEPMGSRAIQKPPAYDSPPAANPSQPILSRSTVAAVESAFNTLANTVLNNNARTLEDLVREMLRPMLKSWLDDNLPGLVERIVKAEIERVSRGR
jgi:cell pole-organizing protein PopZ